MGFLGNIGQFLAEEKPKPIGLAGGVFDLAGEMQKPAPMVPSFGGQYQTKPEFPPELEFAGGPEGKPQGFLGGGSLFKTTPGASTKPITEARETIQALPEKVRATTEQGIGRVRESGRQLQQAEQRHAQALAETQRQKADVLRTGLGAVDQVRQEYQGRMLQAQKRVDDTMQGYEKTKADYMAREVDPDRLLSSGGAKVGSAIAMALGAMGSALSGGPNYAMQIIQSAIDRDIKAQEVELAKAGKAVGMAQNEVGMARQLMGDTQNQKLAAENLKWVDIQKNLELVTMQRADKETLANAAKVNALIAQKIADNEVKMRDNALTREQQAAGQGLQAAVAEVGAKQRRQEFKASQATQKAKVEAAQAKLIAKSSAPPTLALVDPNYTPTTDDTKTAKAMSSAYGRVSKALNKLIAWRAKYGSETIPTEAKRVGRSLAKGVIREFKVMEKMGANFTTLEKELLDIPEDPGEYGYVMASLGTIREGIVDKTVEGMKPYGYTLRAQKVKSKGRKISK